MKSGLKRQTISEFEPSSGNFDSTKEVPIDEFERKTEFDRIDTEIETAWQNLPESVNSRIIDKHLNGRVRKVDTMHEFSETILKAKGTQTDIDSLAGAFVANAYVNDECVGDMIFVARSTYVREQDRFLLVENPAGVFRHEVSHVIDKLSGPGGSQISNAPFFKNLYKTDCNTHSLLADSERAWLEKVDLIGKNNSREELFAQVMASKLGGCSFPDGESLIKRAFPYVWKFVFGEE